MSDVFECFFCGVAVMGVMFLAILGLPYFIHHAQWVEPQLVGAVVLLSWFLGGFFGAVVFKMLLITTQPSQDPKDKPQDHDDDEQRQEES